MQNVIKLMRGSRDDAVVRAHAPPMWPGFDSRRHVWVEFVVGSHPCSVRFFSGYSGFLLSTKTNILKFLFDLELWMKEFVPSHISGLAITQHNNTCVLHVLRFSWFVLDLLLSRSLGFRVHCWWGPCTWPRAAFKGLPSGGEWARVRETGRQQDKYHHKEMQVWYEVHLCSGGNNWSWKDGWLPKKGETFGIIMWRKFALCFSC